MYDNFSKNIFNKVYHLFIKKNHFRHKLIQSHSSLNLQSQPCLYSKATRVSKKIQVLTKLIPPKTLGHKIYKSLQDSILFNNTWFNLFKIRKIKTFNTILFSYFKLFKSKKTYFPLSRSFIGKFSPSHYV